MRRQSIVALATAAVMAAAAGVAAAQAPEGWTAPRTADGRPDLGGVWASDSATPLQRPEELGDRAFLTDEEVAALAAHANDYSAVGGDAVFGETPFRRALAALDAPAEDERDGARPARRRSTGSYNQFWMSGRWFENRTSLIVDPPNGRRPARTPEAEERSRRQREARSAPPADRRLTLAEEVAGIDPAIRCRGGGALLSGRGYNSTYQIFQSADWVGIQIEMHHDTRLIPIGDAAPSRVGPSTAMGSSRGRWEGDTLVVETTNLSRGVGGSTAECGHRALHPGGPRAAAIRVHPGRSVHVDAAVDRARLHAPEPDRGPLLGFACARGELTRRARAPRISHVRGPDGVRPSRIGRVYIRAPLRRSRANTRPRGTGERGPPGPRPTAFATPPRFPAACTGRFPMV